MRFNEEDASNLEQLLESLIKMVGKANKNVDSLQKRVSELEWFVREWQMEMGERDRIRIYSDYPRKRREKVPTHL